MIISRRERAHAPPHSRVQEQKSKQVNSLDPDADYILSELENKQRELSTKLSTLEKEYDEVKDYYKPDKLCDRAMEIHSRDCAWDESDLLVEEKKSSTLPLVREIKRVNENLNSELSLLREYQKKLAGIKIATDIAQDEQEEIKQGLLSAILIAADSYCLKCNEALGTSKQKAETIQKYEKGAWIFTVFFPVRYNQNDYEKFKRNDAVEAVKNYTLTQIRDNLNDLIKITTEKKDESCKELEVALTCLNEAVNSKQMLKNKVSFSFEKGKKIHESALKLGEFKSVEALSQELNEKVILLKSKYLSKNIGNASSPSRRLRLNEIEIKKLSHITQKATEVQDVLDRLHPREDFEYKAIKRDLEEKKTVLERKMRATIESFNASVNTLKDFVDEVKNVSQISSECYLAYKDFIRNRKTFSQLNAEIESEKLNIKNSFETLKFKFNGPEIDREYQEEMQSFYDKLEEPMSRTLQNVESTLSRLNEPICGALGEHFTKETWIKDVLKFLKEQVFSDDNLKLFWSPHTSTYGCRCFMFKVKIGDNSFVVPKGVGKMRNELKSKNIDALSFEEAKDLLYGVTENQIAGILNERLNKGGGRQQPTTDLLNAIKDLIDGGLEGLTKQAVIKFKTDIREKISGLILPTPKVRQSPRGIDLSHLTPTTR